MDTLSGKGVAVEELEDLWDDIGLLTRPNEADDAAIRETYGTLDRALKLLLVAGHLDRHDLAKAMEIAESLQ